MTMESWQKELKELLGYRSAGIYQGDYYGNAANPTIVQFTGGGMPHDLAYARVKDLIATHILPSFPAVKYIGKFSTRLPYPFYGEADISTMTEFARAVNSVKNMKEDAPTDGGNEPAVSEADQTPLLILIAAAFVLWFVME